MARIVEAGAIVSNREFLYLLYGARVVNRNGRIVAKRVQEEHLLLAKALHGTVNQLNHAQYAVLGLQWHADNRPRLPLGHLVNAFGKAGIVINIRDDE